MLKSLPTKEKQEEEIKRKYSAPKYRVMLDIKWYDQISHQKRKYVKKELGEYYFFNNYPQINEKIDSVFVDSGEIEYYDLDEFGTITKKVYYLVIDTEIMKKIKNKLIKDYDPKIFLEEYVRKYRWDSDIAEYRYFIPKYELKLYLYNIWGIHKATRIRTKNFSFQAQNGTRLVFKIEEKGIEYTGFVYLIYSDEYEQRIPLEWESLYEPIPILFFDIPLELPSEFRKLVMSVFTKDINPYYIEDGEDLYDVLPIVFDIQENKVLQNEEAFIKALDYTTEKWREYTISYPPKYKKPIHIALDFLDKNNILFRADQREQIKNIIFSNIITGWAGTVKTELPNIYIDLMGAYEGNTILHELLHKCTLTEDWLPFLREAFTELMTIILSETPEKSFSATAESAASKKRSYHRMPGRYILFPYLIYRKFIREKIEIFREMFVAESQDELVKYLKEVFEDKLYYEEILYINDKDRREHHPTYKLYEEINDYKLFRAMYIIYFFKENFSKEYTYEISAMSPRDVSYTKKGLKVEEYHLGDSIPISYHFADYVNKTPEIQTLFIKLEKFIRSLKNGL